MSVPVISVQADIREAMAAFRGFEDQIPYAAAKAINAVAVEAQKRQRAHQRVAFTVRRPPFVDRAVKIKPFAKKSKLEAVILIDPPGGAARRDVLTKFEKGGVKRPRDGKRLAVPEVRETRISRADSKRRPKNIPWKVRGQRGDTTVLQGPGGLFMIKRADGTGGIYQRKTNSRAKGRKGARRMASSVDTRRVRDLNVGILYRFTPRAKIDDRLHFTENVQGVVRAEFVRHFEVQLRNAVATRKR